MAKELRPRLVLEKSKGRNGGGAGKYFLIFLVAFVLGVFIGKRMDGVGLGGIESVKKDTKVINPQIDIGRRERPDLQENLAFERGIGEEDSTYKEDSDTKTVLANPVSRISEKKDDINITQSEALRESDLNEDPKEYGYTLQVAAFKEKEAEGVRILVNELEKKGYHVYTVPISNSKGEVWSLLKIGKFKTREEAKNFAVLLQEREGMKASVEKISYNVFKELGY